ncbi:MAG: endonuclease NucS domain-containing protein [Candidatus Methylomirabilales bacterium]
MPQQVRLWKVESGDRLRELVSSDLDVEVRIENWLAEDIRVLDPDLMVIGRQVETDFGGAIDLLCIDESGDLVIVELKRDKTPREVTAQVLDYASWVAGLSSDRLSKIADQFLGDRGPLAEAFKQRFGKELPDSINEDHRMLVVGSRIDPSSERIISYLSDSYGVNINAATFQYFRPTDGHELLARVFLLEPSQVEYQTRTKGSTKRLPNLTYEELEDMANRKGVGDLYRYCVSRLQAVLGRHTTRSSIGFTANLDGSRKTVFSLVPRESSEEKGLRFQIYTSIFGRAFNLSEAEVRDLLPHGTEAWSPWPGASGFAGHFTDVSQVDRFLSRCTAAKH